MSLPVHCHLLTWEKYKEMTTSRKGSLSSVAPKKQKVKKWRWAREARHHLLHMKKMQKMTMSQGGSLSFATPEKNAEDDDELGGFWLIIISWVFFQLWVH